VRVEDIEKVVYICHEYGGNPENAAKVAKLVTELSLKYPEIVFVSPVHAFGFMYRDVSYIHGMIQCLTLLDMCTEMWVFGEKSNSRGCKIEKEYCDRYKIPIVERGDYDGN
jgi:hypothetical protein